LCQRRPRQPRGARLSLENVAGAPKFVPEWRLSLSAETKAMVDRVRVLFVDDDEHDEEPCPW